VARSATNEAAPSRASASPGGTGGMRALSPEQIADFPLKCSNPLRQRPAICGFRRCPTWCECAVYPAQPKADGVAIQSGDRRLSHHLNRGEQGG